MAVVHLVDDPGTNRVSFKINKMKSTIKKTQISLGGSPGLVVMEEDLGSRGCEFESLHQALDGYFSLQFVMKIVFCSFEKDRKLTKKRQRIAHFSKEAVIDLTGRNHKSLALGIPRKNINSTKRRQRMDHLKSKRSCE